jgi:hypothetical protein
MSTYSTDLRIQLIADGDQAGTWGQTTNTNLGTIIEQAIAGVSGGPATTGTYPAVNFPTDADITLTANNGSVDQARNAVLAVTSTGNLTAQRNIIAPTGASKVYIIKNNTTGGQNVQIKYSTGTGVIVGNGLTALVYGDGTNFNLVSSASGGGSNNTQVQQFTATQGQTVFSLTYTYTPNTNSMLVFVNGSKQIAGVNYTETSNTVITFASGLNAGDLVEAVYGIASSTAVITSANVSYNQGSTGAINTNVQTKLRETVSVKDFGAVGDGVTDDLAAFQAAIQSFPDTLNTTFYKQGGTVLVPFGKYYLSDTLKIDRNIILKGVSAPYANALGGTILEFADNRDGILVEYYTTTVSGKMGSGTVIEGLYIQRRTTSGTVGSGISLKTMARIVNVTCRGFREHGIKIDASTSSSPVSNANLWEVHSCTLDSNGLHGLFVRGADANAGAAYNVNASYNGGWGIYDNSFLGNTYVACHTDQNTLGAYKSDGLNARNMFLGCYSESGQPVSSIVAPAMIVGGLHAAGYGATDSALDTGGNLYGGLLSNSSFATGKMNIGAGQPNTSGTGTQFVDTSGVYPWTFSKTTGRWGYQWANLSTPSGFQFYDRTATPANGYARDLSAANGAYGISEYYFGYVNEMKLRTLGTAAPVSGTYLQGDIVYNSAPTAGGTIGWVCTTAGTPGTWKTFGAIAA